MPGKRKSRGFTLMELLVVVAIIVMLVAILLPSLGKARNKAVETDCRTKVHALGTALQIYFSEWNATVPTNGIIMPKSGMPSIYQANDPSNLRFQNAEARNPDQWRLEFGGLWTYMGGFPVDASAPLPLPQTSTSMAKRYVCKADSPTMSRTYTSGDANGTKPLYLDTTTPGVAPHVLQGVGAPGYWSYSINSVLNPLGRFRDRFYFNGEGALPWSDPFKETSMKYSNDSALITFIEEDNASLFNDEVMDAPAYSEGDLLTSRHEFGGVVGFLDGHAEYFKATQFNYVPSALKDASGNVNHTDAMQSPITRMFFPDAGRFAGGN